MIGFRRRGVGGDSGDSGPLDFPIVRYAPLGGPEIEIESPVGSRPRVHRARQAVTVFYDTADPRRARIRSGCLQYALPLLFIALGLTLFGGAFGIGAWFLLRAAARHGRLPALVLPGGTADTEHDG